ncbi:hypothetical protein OGAPHI_001586 [Ogataea philodendri]|uniref:Structural maintenance of chromosomes protein n=1 Tax=Ogataea philodendri TaxID=1378263 RepID=A0A9P8PD28_9ASCO|nr:uncharacterized protein OGAPHI_001586 [Ogataea philodendri]KAH3669465.1 hypothetical protein OGAPHI_001586 [Ogataea philodendri]
MLGPRNVNQQPVQVVALKPENPGPASQQTNGVQSQYSMDQKPDLEEQFQPRLVIEQLVLTNFKSYAGRQVVGPFNSSFSAVVGPNGSGKSNVIDSLLFVFGFRATKMRQSKLSELIHNSENFPNLNFCQVDIHFKTVLDSYDENGELQTEALPVADLVVSRKAYRTNSSEYYINDKKCTYTEVQTLLKDQGIDLDHKRFLILQGEVESIAQMKPKAEGQSDDGLLEYLEDIIGTAKYKASIEGSLVQIDELNEVCVQKEHRYEIVEKAKNDLEAGKETALTFLRKEKSLSDKQSVYLQCRLLKDKGLLSEKKASLETLKQKLTEMKHQNAEHIQQVEEETKRYHELSSEVKHLEKEVTNLKNAHKKIEKEKVSMDEKIKHNENRKKKAEKAQQTSSSQLRESESKIADLERNQQEYTAQSEQLTRTLDQEKKQLESIKVEVSEKTKDLSMAVSKLQQEMEPWKDKIGAKQAEIDIKTSQLEIVKNKLQELETETSNLEGKAEEKLALAQAKKKQIAHLKKEKLHVAEQIKLGEKEVNEAKKKLDAMESEITSLRDRMNEANVRVTNTQSRNRVLQALTHLKNSGRLTGFHGRLGDLGVIDDKYDVAVSTGGGSLDDMVVDTVEIAQQCISYMRKNNLGFGKFIVLDKLRKFNLSKIQTPNNVPRLFDLITPVDPKFAPAFYSSMYNTLVSRNLQEANKVAFGAKRWRVVTLDGKLVDTSGTLSGGGNRMFRGAMRLKSAAKTGNEISETELKAMADEVQLKEDAFTKAQSAFYEMENALSNFHDRLPEIDMEISKLELEHDMDRQEAEAAKARSKDVLANKDKLAKMHKQIVEESTAIEKLESEKKSLKDQSQGLADQIAEIQEKIMEAGGVKLKMQQSKVESVLQKLEILNEKESSDSLQLTKLHNMVTRLKGQISENSIEIQEAENDISKIKETYDSSLRKFQSSEKELEELTSQLEDVTEKCEQSKEELNAKQSQIADLRKEEIKLASEVERCESSINSYERNIKKITNEIGTAEYRELEGLIGWMEDGEEKQQLLAPPHEYTPEELEKVNPETLEAEIEELEKEVDSMTVDLDTLHEYARRFKEFTERKADLNESVVKRDELKEACENLKKQRLDEFMAGFNQISLTLKQMYQMITMGGNAELELVDSLDPFSEGILFSVMPPKKSWKNISNLSGGEKTLSSLALVFALHRYKPTPLYVMDEIDAALDFRNVSIVANYIKERTKNAQFIVISLRNNMFELAKQLVGIYKVSNMTKSITLQNRDIISQ